MESDQKSELIDQVIRKLLAEKGNEDENNQLLLSKLLSEFEISKSEELVDQKEEEVSSSSNVEKSSGKNETQNINAEEIMNELKKVKKQNSVTHWLLSAMIVLTLAWQVSEVSLLWHLKNGITHPFRLFGGRLVGMFRVPGISAHDKERINSSSDSDSVALQMPELPHMPDFTHKNVGSDDKKSRRE